ncbi:MAG: hypothetical protein HKN27_14480 [Silicimonas sp.]|nr:hypothetical protein [Silicimonas sp.]
MFLSKSSDLMRMMRKLLLVLKFCVFSVLAATSANALTTFESCIDLASETTQQAVDLLQPQIDWETSTAGQDQRYEFPLSDAELMKTSQGLAFAHARLRAVALGQGVDVSVFGDPEETSVSNILRSLKKDAEGSRMTLAAVLYDRSSELVARCADISGKGN